MAVKAIPCAIFFAAIMALCPFAASADSGDPVAWWKFNAGPGPTAVESMSRIENGIQGNYRFIDGASGTGLKFDGFTTRVRHPAAAAPRLNGAFTFEAWIAPQEYPWNWCAILDQSKNWQDGYFFGIDAYGRVGLLLSVGGRWRECVSERKVPYMAWSHVAATFDPAAGVVLYIDGTAAGTFDVKGKMDTASDTDLLIGRNHQKLPPTDLVRPKVSFPSSYSFDGILDEVKITDRALPARQIEQAFRTGRPKGKLALEWRKWPALPGPRRFGAVYTRLKFFEEWDALWKVADVPDVVVHFDDLPGKMVFWRGTNYNMNLVTEDGRWVGDQSAEGGGGKVIGCCEHMSDKQCRYAHVRIIENHDARVVVHWRYALVDVLYRIAMTDTVTDWGTWADEFYSIYPDGVAVRHFLIHGARDRYSITEPAALNQPGERAEDNLSMEAAVLANMDGQVRAFSWDPWPGTGAVAADFANPLPNANISVVNFKSNCKPFYVYEPGTRIIPYGGGLKETTDFSRFPTWNHWPVAQLPCDGRMARAADRFTSSAVTSPKPPMKRNTDGSLEGSFIMGLMTGTVESLSPLARSWLKPPKLDIRSSGFSNQGYCKNERAFRIRCESGKASPLEFELETGERSPLMNPAFVLENWGDGEIVLKIDGVPIPRGKDFRYGHRFTETGTDLIVWLKHASTKPVRVSIGGTRSSGFEQK